MPYAEEDFELFFGREQECKLVEANLMASRLTLLYGSSGVGKSSLLSAGVTHHLRAQSSTNFEELGCLEFVVVYHNDWREDPVTALAAATHRSVSIAMGGGETAFLRSAEDLDAMLWTWCQRINGELFVIFDQFEEYFLYHPEESTTNGFGAQLARAIKDPDLPVNFLISLRDDALAQLDRFKGHIPSLFSNYLRVERLDRDCARHAIQGPIDFLNRERAEGVSIVIIEPTLVEAVLDQVEAGRVGFDREAAGGLISPIPEDGRTRRIDTPYLQLVLDRLWREEMEQGSHVLRLVTLEALGGADRIIRTHLDGVMEQLTGQEREISNAIFHLLVTPSLTKIAHTAADLAHYTEINEERLTTVLERLCTGDARVLRPLVYPDRPDQPRYEIYHDVLASAILDWRQRFRQIEADQRVVAAKAAQEKAEVSARSSLMMLVMLIGNLIFLLITYFSFSFNLNSISDRLFARLQTVNSMNRIPWSTQVVIRPPVKYAFGVLAERLDPELRTGQLELRVEDNRAILVLAQSGLFLSGSAAISENGRFLVERIGDALQHIKGHVLVVGHTDNMPVRSVRFPSNWHLSQERARAVAEVIAQILRSNERLVFEGRADSEPVASNNSREGRERNRRVEIILFPREENL